MPPVCYTVRNLPERREGGKAAMRFNINDNIIVRALGKICDLMCLNILWLVCSIPIFTIGASTTALYTVVLKMVKNEEGYIFRGFFKAFKSNFKQSTITWIILLILGILCWIDQRIVSYLPGTAGTVLNVLVLIVSFILLAVMIYVFPLIARYENTLSNTLKNAVLLSIAKLPYTLIMMAVIIGAVIASMWTGYTLLFAIPLWCFIGVSAIACINSYLLRRAFLVFEENEDKTEEEGAE